LPFEEVLDYVHVKIDDPQRIAEETKDHLENKMRSTDEHPLVTPESHIRPGSGEQFRQLRSLINNMQGIKELLLFQPRIF